VSPRRINESPSRVCFIRQQPDEVLPFGISPSGRVWSRGCRVGVLQPHHFVASDGLAQHRPVQRARRGSAQRKRSLMKPISLMGMTVCVNDIIYFALSLYYPVACRFAQISLIESIVFWATTVLYKLKNIHKINACVLGVST
jgi:hypothetical protein